MKWKLNSRSGVRHYHVFQFPFPPKNFTLRLGDPTAWVQHIESYWTYTYIYTHIYVRFRCRQFNPTLKYCYQWIKASVSFRVSNLYHSAVKFSTHFFSRLFLRHTFLIIICTQSNQTCENMWYIYLNISKYF